MWTISFNTFKVSSFLSIVLKCGSSVVTVSPSPSINEILLNFKMSACRHHFSVKTVQCTSIHITAMFVITVAAISRCGVCRLLDTAGRVTGHRRPARRGPLQPAPLLCKQTFQRRAGAHPGHSAPEPALRADTEDSCTRLLLPTFTRLIISTWFSFA